MKNPPRDPNQFGKYILDKVTEKDPLAVELGRRGGLKGGKARAEKLSPDRRSKIAKHAAKARWKDKK